MNKYTIRISKGTHRVWSSPIEVNAETEEEAHTKALALAEENPQGNDVIVWEEDGDINLQDGNEEQPYFFQVEDTEDIRGADDE